MVVALRCNETKSLCDNNECMHGGTCQMFGNIRYTCTCAVGYTGQNCETDIGKLNHLHSHSIMINKSDIGKLKHLYGSTLLKNCLT